VVVPATAMMIIMTVVAADDDYDRGNCCCCDCSDPENDENALHRPKGSYYRPMMIMGAVAVRMVAAAAVAVGEVVDVEKVPGRWPVVVKYRAAGWVAEEPVLVVKMIYMVADRPVAMMKYQMT
jgi:hypothetical protein